MIFTWGGSPLRDNFVLSAWVQFVRHRLFYVSMNSLRDESSQPDSKMSKKQHGSTRGGTSAQGEEKLDGSMLPPGTGGTIRQKNACVQAGKCLIEHPWVLLACNRTAVTVFCEATRGITLSPWTS